MTDSIAGESSLDGTETTGTDQGTTESTQTFTQDEVNEIIKQRLARQKSQYSDYSELKKFKADFEQQRLSSLSENEKAIEQAKAEARLEAQRDYGIKLAGAEVRAAISPFVDDVEDIVEDLNLSKFVMEDGSVDTLSVKKLKSKYEKLYGKKTQSQAGQIAGHGIRNKAKSGTPLDDFSAMLEKFHL